MGISESVMLMEAAGLAGRQDRGDPHGWLAITREGSKPLHMGGERYKVTACRGGYLVSSWPDDPAEDDQGEDDEDLWRTPHPPKGGTPRPRVATLRERDPVWTDKGRQWMPRVMGYAVLWGDVSRALRDEDGEEYRTCFAPGSFDGTVARGAGVSAVVNHDKSALVAGPGALDVWPGSRGLVFECGLSVATRAGWDVLSALREGRCNGVSFHCTDYRQNRRWERVGGERVLVVQSVGGLVEITFCLRDSRPAFPNTKQHLKLFETRKGGRRHVAASAGR